MPITLPNLDDRRFEDLVDEALARIPAHAPEWTNYNESDPGITLVELFAYLTELLIYRQNRISDANVCSFLKLMDGVKRTPVPNRAGYVMRDEVEVSLEDEVRDAVLTLRTRDRAITSQDFEELALKADPRVKRAYCVPQRDLTKSTPDERQAEADAHVSMIVVPAMIQFDSVLLFGGEQNAPLFKEDDLIDPTSLIDQLRNDTTPLSKYLFNEILGIIDSFVTDEQRPGLLISGLDRIINGPSLYDPSLFAGINLRPETQSLLTQALQGQDLMRLNRMLLEDAYPDRIKKREFFTDVTTAAFQSGANISLLPRTDKTDPRLYLGSNTVFGALGFELAASGKNYALTFKYFDGKQNDWVQLTDKDHQLIDNTANWSSSGVVTFTPPPDWKQSNVNGTDMYWISVSTSTTPAPVAVANQIGRNLMEKVRLYLEPRRLLTTQVHVVGPRYLTVAVHVTLFLKPDAVGDTVKGEAELALQKFFDPLSGGTDGKGWPFGRNVYVSEVYALLDRLPGIDYVTTAIDPETLSPLKNDATNQPYTELTVVPDDSGRVIPPGTAPMEGIRLEPDELVAFSPEKSHLQIVDRKIAVSKPLLKPLNIGRYRVVKEEA
ncbi:MAG TPA: hypothetical protein VF791_14845 [Pyrinomonadaceae bacterium]